ncbi:hypothetical protein SERLA73DRAFT_47343, partial [Serpula lacrymans var. lacrymans S7.3]
ANPLVHHRRHFGRTVHVLHNILMLVDNGMQYLGELTDTKDANMLTAEEMREYAVFKDLLQMVPGLQACLQQSSSEETDLVASLVGYMILFSHQLIAFSNRFNKVHQVHTQITQKA